MTISKKMLQEAIGNIGQVQGIAMRAEHLVEDVTILAFLYPDEQQFTTAVDETVRELELLVSGKKKGIPLNQNHQGILKSPYQSVRKNGQKADLRIAYDEGTDPLRIRAFGNRWLPQTFYSRLQIRKDNEDRP